MKKGESSVTPKELETLQKLTARVETYENEVYFFFTPKTIIEMVEMTMFENKLSLTDYLKKQKYHYRN